MASILRDLPLAGDDDGALYDEREFQQTGPLLRSALLRSRHTPDPDSGLDGWFLMSTMLACARAGRPSTSMRSVPGCATMLRLSTS